MFCVVTTAHKFDFRLVINETPKNGDRWKGTHAVTETHVVDRICIFSLSVFASVKGLYPRCAGQLYSLE
jgi:hypothetical protein